MSSDRALVANTSESTMGGERMRLELDKPNDFKNDLVVWHYCTEGGVAEYLENLRGHDEQLSIQFATS